MRGLMSKSYNYDQNVESKVIKDTIETPIKHSFIEGLTISEYFNSSYGARKGMSDTAMKTSKSGYMTRKLVDATQEVIIKETDCFVNKGFLVSDIVDTKTDVIIESLAERITDRYPVENILHPKTGEIISAAGTLISSQDAQLMQSLGINEVEIRSVLFCRAKQGVCQRCFGIDLTTRKPIEIGMAIGVVAAQSIGEPGTQLTMRTFHTGGVSGGANIAQATISEIDGLVESIEKASDGLSYSVLIKNPVETVAYTVNINSIFRIKRGDRIKAGEKIVDGSISIPNLLLVAGIGAVRQYMIKEVQKVYRSQGIEISDKYVEVIIRQLTNKLVVQDPGDSQYFSGEVVELNAFTNTNTLLLNEGKVPASAVNIVFGLEEAPSKADSFLSAASFQDTKKILIDAAVRSKRDKLTSLKENVILGNLIPSGSALMDTQELIARAEATNAITTRLFLPKEDLISFIEQHVDLNSLPNKVLVISSKIVSLAQNRIVAKSSYPIKLDLIRAESEQIIGFSPQAIPIALVHGLLMADAGIDESNVPNHQNYILLPKDPYPTCQGL
ncbi:unnamed protein product [Didymodactylos carnosus]|uniref:DNA-directed RNA polymerase n=1 Tax=Didymodactylos carnosus TaxID=1234261 RepID=A0A8S2CMV8_9BILA|nr:unnamed protein product [Didymodactylos carnosus]CAF3492217.1 unnamed protein product [Didymodactylos carnosus]